MKRFYTKVSTHKSDDGFSVHLDGKPIKTPQKKLLMTHNEELAALVAAEWEEQEEKIDPAKMPVTQILNTRVDKFPTERPQTTEQILRYFNTDLICYYAEEPQELFARQKSAWNDAHLWFAQKAGETLLTTNQLRALQHTPKMHDVLSVYINELDEERFVILQLVTPLCGSIVLAASFVDGAMSAEDVLKACFVEEDYKSELYNADFYGQDPHLQKKRTTMQQDLEASDAILAVL